MNNLEKGKEKVYISCFGDLQAAVYFIHDLASLFRVIVNNLDIYKVLSRHVPETGHMDLTTDASSVSPRKKAATPASPNGLCHDENQGKSTMGKQGRQEKDLPNDFKTLSLSRARIQRTFLGAVYESGVRGLFFCQFGDLGHHYLSGGEGMPMIAPPQHRGSMPALSIPFLRTINTFQDARDFNHITCGQLFVCIKHLAALN